MFIDTRERPAGEVQQKVGRIKLSEAIRIGARIRPQQEGSFFLHGKSCAMGAAIEGAGLPYREHHLPSPEAVKLFPELFSDEGRGFSSLGRKIFMKNDTGKSREEIADWLAAQGL